MSIFMQYGNIKGEASDKNHKQWVNISAVQMESLRQITAGSSTKNDRESSVTQFKEILVERYMDKASPDLFAAHAIGKGQDLTLHFTKTGSGDGADAYLELILRHALISAYKINAHEDSSMRPLEHFAISYTAIDTSTSNSTKTAARLRPRRSVSIRPRTKSDNDKSVEDYRDDYPVYGFHRRADCARQKQCRA